MESGRGRKGPPEGKTLGPTGTLAQVNNSKGGKLDGRRQAQLARGNPLGRPEWEGSTDEQWRPAYGSVIQVDSRSATGRERGREKWVKIKRHKRLIQVKDGGR